MQDAICSVAGCDERARARTVCISHYGQARRNRTLDDLPLSLARHALSDIDTDDRTAICSACGPVKIRLSKGRWGCGTSRRGTSEKTPAARKRKRLRENYGISYEEYDLLVQAQGGKCLICRTPAELVVDHDHQTGLVRGLLCLRCNVALGWMNDSIVNLERAARYLRRPAA